MKLPLSWVRDYVDLKDAPREIADRLTMAGLEIEGMDEVVPIPGVVVGEVKACKKHPNADKLSVCEVDDGNQVLQIVCGAPNVKAGIKVPLATIGTCFPGGFEIKKTKLRGEESCGMICSDRELGLSDEHTGIKILPETYQTGKDFWEELPKREPVLEVAITPNRGDCLSIMGLARELAAIYPQQMKPLPIDVKTSGGKSSDKISIKIENEAACPRYVGQYIADVRIGPSPEWLARRLTEAGMRPINNIVDITNYVMLETGQPLHAFDYGKIKKGEVNVRSARKDEKFTTLDGKEHQLSPDNLLICNHGQPIALAGVMGGLESEVDANTTEILLESAHFDPVTIRKSAKAAGVKTESSYRFERGVDPNICGKAALRAAQLMAELAGGAVAEGVVDIYPKPVNPKKIKIRLSRVNRLLGTVLSADAAKELLERLEITAVRKNDDEFCVEVPTFRFDLEREADLAEEIARTFGYDSIPIKKNSRVHFSRPADPSDTYIDEIRSIMVGLGFCEVYCNSLLSAEEQKIFLGDSDSLALLNPVSNDYGVLRASLLPGLLKSAQWNMNRKNEDLQFFEIGRIFQVSGKDQPPKERMMLSGFVAGLRNTPGWYENLSHNFSSLKGYLEVLFHKISLDKITFITYSNNERDSFLTPESAKIEINGKEAGRIGQLSKEVCKQLNLQTPLYIFEIQIDPLTDTFKKSVQYKSLPKFPPVDRDFAFLFDANMQSEAVLAEVRSISPLVEETRWFDMYSGDQIEKGKKSLALSVRFRSGDRTLEDKEIDKISEEIIKLIKKKFNGLLRKE